MTGLGTWYGMGVWYASSRDGGQPHPPLRSSMVCRHPQICPSSFLLFRWYTICGTMGKIHQFACMHVHVSMCVHMLMYMYMCTCINTSNAYCTHTNTHRFSGFPLPYCCFLWLFQMEINTFYKMHLEKKSIHLPNQLHVHVEVMDEADLSSALAYLPSPSPY